MQNKTVVAGVLLLLGSSAAWSQSGFSSIRGTVLDASNSSIPAATVTITEANTGRTFSRRTGTDGSYLFPDLLPGKYALSGEANAFKRLTIENLNLAFDVTLTQDLQLEVASARHEEITVSGTTNLADTVHNTVSTSIDVTHVLELPFSDRFVFGLANLAPASFFKTFSDDPSGTRLTQISLGGGRFIQTLALIDGVDNTRGDGMGPQTVELEPPPDVLQEFRVETNNLAAEYGRTGGGVVNATIKSGTNALHGDLYEFLRNDALDAAGWGNTRKPELRRNTAGGTVGGAIIKNRTFFFGGYEHLWNNQGNTSTVSVGLAAWRSGNFATATRDANGAAAFVPIYDPATGGTQQFSGNVIPSSRLDSAALKAISYVPLGNQTAVDSFNNSGNWQSYPVATYRRSYYVARVDHEWSAATRFFVRYIGTPDRSIQAGGVAADPTWGAASSQQDNPTFTQNTAVNMTHTFSPNFFVSLTAGIMRLQVTTGNVDNPSINYPQQLGMPNVPGPQFPNFSLGGGLVPVDTFGGGPNRVEKGLYSNNFVNFIRIKGAHTIKFGVDYNRFNNNDYNYNQGPGVWTFNGSYTQGVGANGLPLANTGINLADFLLGDYTSVSVTRTPTFGRRAQAYGGYMQDDWAVAPRLTLNLGLRYETQTPAYSPTNAFQSFNPYVPNPLAGTNGIPLGAMGVTVFENRNGVGKYLYDWDYKHGFMPRVGLAWRPTKSENTVVRAGFGLFFTNPTPQGTYLNGALGFGQVYTASYAARTNPSPALSSGIAAGVLALPAASALTPTFGDLGTAFPQSSIGFYDPKLALPYSENINFTMQHQWRGTLFEAGYLGNLGRHLSGTSQNINLVPQQLLSQTSIAVRLRRPFPEFSGSNAAVTSYENNTGISNYNAFTFKAERRMKNGIAWTVAYTWSKWIDNMNFESVSNVNLGDNNGVQNLYARGNERSLSQNDIPQRLVASPVAELPFGRGKHWQIHNSFVNALAGGWQIGLLATIQSGSPFGPTVLNGGANLLGDASQILRPNLVGNPVSAQQWQPAVGVRGIQYLNPAAFANPAAFTYGSQARTLPGILGPGVRQFNFDFSKNFEIAERYRLQIRADILDLFNTPQFSLPAESFGGSNFGVITATDNSTRRIVEMGVKIYF